MPLVLTRELVEQAIDLVRPGVERILGAKGTTWGPKWAECMVKVPGVVVQMGHPEYALYFRFGEETPWQPEWGKEIDFTHIASSKLDVVQREGMSTSLVVATRPWCLNTGEYLYPGGVARDGIYVAVSGAKGWVDEAIAEMVASAIVMLVHLKVAEMSEKGQEQI